MKLFGNCWPGLVTPPNLFKNAHPTIAGLVFALAIFAFAPRCARAVVHASIIVDAQTGEVLQAHNPDKLAHPASLAKLMTLYITFQQLDSGKLTLSEKLRVSLHASLQQPTRLGLRAGSVISVRSAILGMVTKSANDAAVVLAEGISGSEPRFARLMTYTARQLGMDHTTFHNASGLPNPRQWTTARDMSNLALSLISDFPGYYHFFGVRSFMFHGRLIRGHNHLLDRYAGTDGLKTGYIHSSGYNLVTSVVRDHQRLVGVVMGGETARARDLSMTTLLDRGFSTRSALPVVRRADQYRIQHRKVRIVLATDELQAGDLNNGGSHWVVQIGRDFSCEQSVRRVLESAVRTAPSSLGRGRELVVRLSSGSYRARFSRLTEKNARTACHILAREGFACRFFEGRPLPDSTVEASISPPAQKDGQ